MKMIVSSAIALVLSQSAPPGTLAEAEALAQRAVKAWKAAVDPNTAWVQSVALKKGDVKEVVVQDERTYSNRSWNVAFSHYSSRIEFAGDVGKSVGSNLKSQRLESIGKSVLSVFVGHTVRIDMKEEPISYSDNSTITYVCGSSYLGYPVRWELSKLTLARSNGFPLKIEFPSYLKYVRFPRASDPYFERVMSIDKLEVESEKIFLATGPFAESASLKGHAYWSPSNESALSGSLYVRFLNKKPIMAKLTYEKVFNAELKNGEDHRYISIDAVSGEPMQTYDLMASMVFKIGYRDPDLSEIKAGTEFRVIGPRRLINRNILSIEKANNDEPGKTVLVKLSNGRYYKGKYLGLGKFLIKGNLVVTDIKTWEIDGLLAEPLIRVPGFIQ